MKGIDGKYPRFIAENGIKFYKPISFPSKIKVGIKVVNLSDKAVTYNVGFFEYIDGNDDDENLQLAACGKFVHVYVDLKTGRPITIPDEARNVLSQLLVED